MLLTIKMQDGLVIEKGSFLTFMLFIFIPGSKCGSSAFRTKHGTLYSAVPIQFSNCILVICVGPRGKGIHL